MLGNLNQLLSSLIEYFLFALQVCIKLDFLLFQEGIHLLFQFKFLLTIAIVSIIQCLLLLVEI
jgi:hypothetical protein